MTGIHPRISKGQEEKITWSNAGVMNWGVCSGDLMRWAVCQKTTGQNRDSQTLMSDFVNLWTYKPPTGSLDTGGAEDVGLWRRHQVSSTDLFCCSSPICSPTWEPFWWFSHKRTPSHSFPVLSQYLLFILCCTFWQEAVAAWSHVFSLKD